MEQLIELLRQIEELAGVGIKALEGASGGAREGGAEAAAEAAGGPEGAGPPPEGPPPEG